MYFESGPGRIARLNAQLMERLPEDAMVLNCAGCGLLLLAKKTQHVAGAKREAGRIKGRPYCRGCLELERP